MATIKSFTDLPQSKKLAEILPLESADMHSEAVEINGDMVFVVVCGLGDKTKPNYGSPVWSLAALLEVLQDVHLKKYIYNGITKYYVTSVGIRQFNSEHYDNPVDACVELIIKLNELKML